jgi:hypothetical protein
VRLAANVIAGNLQCQANSAAPDSAGNSVSGQQVDQCAQAGGQRLYLPAIVR